MAKSRVITLTVSEKLLKQIDKASKKRGVTRAEFIRSGCRSELTEDDVEYWEDEKGNFGLRFPRGIDAADFLQLMEDFEAREKARKNQKK